MVTSTSIPTTARGIDVLFELPAAENFGVWRWSVVQQGRGQTAMGYSERRHQAIEDALRARDLAELTLNESERGEAPE